MLKDKIRLTFSLRNFLVYSILAINNVPYLYYKLHGMVTILPLFVLWLLIDAKNIFQIIKNINENKIYFIPPIIYLMFIFVNAVLLRGGTPVESLKIGLNSAVMLIITIRYSYDFNYLRKMIIFVILIGGTMTLLASYMMYNNFNLVRYTTQVAEYGSQIRLKFNLMGVGSYDVFTFYALIVPYLFAIMHSNINSIYTRLISGIYLISATLCTTLSGSAGAFFITIFGLIMCLLWQIKRSKLSMLIYVVAFIFAIFIISNVIMERSDFISRIQNAYGVEKFIRILNSKLEGGIFSYEETNRTQLMYISLETAAKKPLWGAGSHINTFNIIGNHCEWADTFAKFGIFAVFNMIFMFIIVIFKYTRLFKRKNIYIFYLPGFISSIMIFIMSAFNPTLSRTFIFTLWVLSTGYIVSLTHNKLELK